MPADPYTVLRALLHAEARRSAPERAAPEPRRTPATEERPSKRPDRD
ncbi:hypothetical protein [Streptomyces brasiliscabiei]|nr:hypothetical protein [Streptomyces brasiliscabiei]